jgi:hypothetical protein
MRARLRQLTRREDGFTMVHVLVVMLAVMSLSAAAFAAAGADFRNGAYDKQDKQAYAAAEAGVADYMSKLNVDNAYWRLCADRSKGVPTYINQQWNGTGTDPRGWRTLSSADGRIVQYSIELLPVKGEPVCDTARANQSMLDVKTGAFQIRATGRVTRPNRSNPAAPITEGKRSVVATFKRNSFLEFLYFTDYETSDPYVYGINTWGKQTRSDLISWATTNCSAYRRDGRGNRTYNGEIYWPSSASDTDPWKNWSSECSEIQFVDGDQVQGPLHTNDELLACGSPDFGRVGKNDKISASSPVLWRGCNSSANPTFNGTKQPSTRKLPLPPNNKALKSQADPAYVFTGKTTIVLSANSMTVNGVTMAYPDNGVIFVQNGICGSSYNPLSPVTNPIGCGDAVVSGTYNKDLTIGAENDIVIDGDLRRPTTNPPDVTLGLIANSFVRVAHPTTTPNTNVNYPPNSSYPSCSNSNAGSQTRTIEAAILALQHSFIVDNYYCGAPLGTLNVFGVIAQKYRGPVGTGSGGNVSTGYLKNYSYDDRLSLRQPPYFLDPAESAWRLRRQSEQTPAR